MLSLAVMSIALVILACYNPTIVKTNVLCLLYLYIVINATRLVNYLVSCLVNCPALVVVTATAAVVAAATTTATAATTTTTTAAATATATAAVTAALA
jgi:hypothetical protein